MPQNIHLETITGQHLESSKEMGAEELAVRTTAADLARSLSWLPGESQSRVFAERCSQLSKALRPLLRRLESRTQGTAISDDSRWLYDNVHLLRSELESVCETFKARQKMPLVRAQGDAIIPRVIVLAEAFLAETAYQFSEKTFTAFVEAFQQQAVLKAKERSMVSVALKLVLLEQIARRGSRAIAHPSESHGVGVRVHSLREVSQTTWKDVLEPLILPDHILRKDPAGAYAWMDLDSRDLYRSRLVDMAERSDFGEMEVAAEVLALAREAQERKEADPRVVLRCSHVGYYLLGGGADLLHQRVGFTPSVYQRISSFLRRYRDEFYITSVLLVTLTLIAFVAVMLIELKL
jgi:hypothetical protein